MTLYDTIFARRAVRKFDKIPLDDEVLSDIQGFVDSTVNIDGQSARFEIVGGNKIKKAVAPYYILAYCDANDCAYANVGYVLQKVDLYLQSIGLGSVWLGSAKPCEMETDYLIMLAFGKTDVPLRAGGQDFKRLPIGEMSDEDNTVAQVARLAPSAVNSQPWKLHFEESKVVIRYFGRGLMKAILKKKMNKVDIGIVTRYVEIALMNEGKTILSIVPKIGGKDFVVEVVYK
ncbi:hypothetical protein LQZ18_17045 [Lachnospiraceae bacterium ZAX-1]